MSQPTSLPSHLHVELTNSCDLSCSFCAYPLMKREKKELSISLFHSLLSQLPEVKEIVFSGVGEPLLSGKESFFISTAKKFCQLASTCLETNATFLNRQRARGIIEAGLDNIIFNFSAISPDTYASVYGKNLFSLVKKNILSFLEMKGDLKSHTPEVFIRFLGNFDTLQDLKPLLKFWKEYSLKVLCLPALNWGRRVSETPNPYNPLGKCPFLEDSITVLSNGWVVMCPWDFEGEYLFGDLKTQTLQEIWESPQRFSLLKNAKSGNICRWCLYEVKRGP